MSNSIPVPSGALLVPVSTPSRGAAPAVDATGSSGRPSAFQDAVERGFEGWFQAPTPQHSIGMPAHAPVGATWLPARIGLHMDAAGASASASAAGAASHGRAASPAGSAHAAATRAAVAADDASPVGSAGLPARTIATATTATASADPRDLALAATVAALGFAQVVLVPAGDVDAPPPVAASGVASGAASGAAAVAPADDGADAPVPDALADDAPAPRDRADQATGERSPLRVHAQWSDDGVRLWLGADVDGLGAVSAVMTQLEQALAGQGTRLLRVVCNGRDISSATPRRLDAATFEPRSPDAGRISRL